MITMGTHMNLKNEVSLALMHQIREIFRDCETQMVRACGEYSVPLSYYYILRVNWGDTGKTQTEISDVAGMSTSLASQVIQKMCNAKLLNRKSDPKDARVKFVHITAKGVQLRGDLIDTCRDVTANIFKDISAKDISTVLEVLEPV